MNGSVNRLAFLLGGAVAFCRADVPTNEANPSDNPYTSIVERNPFGLKPPPPPAPAPAPVVDQSKNDLKLTGITSFGSLKAYFMATDPKSKAPEYFSLGLDEKKDGIEVLAIDDAAKSVRIRNAGVETFMTFTSHGVTPPNTPPPATPGVPGAPGAMPIVPGVAPATPTQSGMQYIPSRTLRGSNGQTTSYGGPSDGVSGMNPLLAARYGLASPSVSNVPTPQPAPQNTRSTEEAVVLMEIQRMANPSLPPTPGLPTTTDIVPAVPGPGVPGPIPPRGPRLPGN